MGESQVHIDLVKLAYGYISTVVPQNLHCMIESDTSCTSRPPSICNNFVPDIYFKFDDLLVIGEAKTLKDFDRNHSLQQYNSYFQECIKHHGESMIVISVPWEIFLSAKNLFRNLKRNYGGNTKVVVINEMGKYEII